MEETLDTGPVVVEERSEGGCSGIKVAKCLKEFSWDSGVGGDGGEERDEVTHP